MQSLFRLIARPTAAALAMSVLLTGLVHGQDSPPNGPEKTDPQERIAELIEQLGDRNFTVRERAQTELARMGIVSFDQLFLAMRSTDLEVARRAQFLVRSVDIEWSQPDYSDAVDAYLNKYGQLNVDDRRSRIGELARLGTADALSALCRITRYEVSEVLSKEAALAAANEFHPTDPQKRAELAELIRETMEFSPRTGARWLKIFAESLTDPDAAIVRWQKEVDDEIKLFTNQPNLTNQKIVLELVRWRVDQLRALDRQEEALVAMQGVIGISVNFSETQLLNLSTWFLDRKGPSLVGELAAYHSRPGPGEAGPVGPFYENPALLYLLAEAQLVQDNIPEAQKFADMALALAPDSYDSHYITALALQERGCFRWSRQEFQYVLDNLELMDSISIRARMQLSEMEYDQENYAAAAEAITPWMREVEKNFSQRQPFDPDADESAGRILARGYLFRAAEAREKGDLDAAKKHVLTGLKYYKDEADVLIMAYQLSEDPEWQAETRKYIDNFIGFYKPYVEKFAKQYEFFKKQRPGQDILGADGSQMSSSCNQYAWLVSNTYGDFDHALESSRLSLEIQPGNGAYLDTLAHCYAAKKQYEEAIETQSIAVRKMPFSGQIRGKYELFAKLAKENGVKFEPIELPDSPDEHFPSQGDQP